MKYLKNKIFLALFLLMGLIFLVSTVGGTRAALIESETYETQFEMYHIGITLNEGGKPLTWRNYQDGDWHVNADTELLKDLTEIKYGQLYKEELSVTNSGQIDEYVRVTIYKYWLDENGQKTSALDAKLIHLNLTDDADWILDTDYSTDERTVLYYALPLESGKTTPLFLNSIILDGSIKNYIIQTETAPDADGYTVVTNIYKYDGKTFCIDVEADGVQTHNAKEAAQSAWGRAITISGDRLSLAKEGQ